MPDFIQQVKAKQPVQNWLEEAGGADKWRIEDSGYLTCIDHTPKEATDSSKQMPKQKKK